jgi:hypothetical protein
MTPFEKPFVYEQLSYRTNEHFYVAMKTKDIEIRKQITEIRNPYEVKQFGYTFPLREGWKAIKISTMKTGIDYKFSDDNPILKQKLIETKDQYIQEGNTWGDSFWGYCFIDEMGKNNLGKLIMERREEIR